MEKAVSQLIDTLNGQVSTLPQLTKEVLHQWVVSHYVLAVVWLVAGVVLALISIAVVKKGIAMYRENLSRWENRGYDYVKPTLWDAPGLIPAGWIAVASTAIAIGESGSNLYSALNPIVTLISNFTDK